MAVSFEFRHLRAFVALADELHFGRAAERLHIAQQALSTQIQQLETRVGAKLFERSTRHVETTPAGDALLEPARALLHGAEEAVAAVEAAEHGRPATLTVGFPVRPVPASAPAIFDRFRASAPGSDVDVHFGDMGDPSGGLLTREADVAFVYPPFTSAGLDMEPLTTEERLVLLPAGHRLAGAPQVALGDLLAEPWLDIEGTDPLWRRFWLALDHRAGSPAVFGATVRSADGLVEGVRLGLGVALAPASVADEVAATSRGVVARPVAGLEPCTLAVAWRSGEESPAASRFLDCALSAYRPRLKVVA